MTFPDTSQASRCRPNRRRIGVDDIGNYAQDFAVYALLPERNGGYLRILRPNSGSMAKKMRNKDRPVYSGARRIVTFHDILGDVEGRRRAVFHVKHCDPAAPSNRLPSLTPRLAVQCLRP